MNTLAIVLLGLLCVGASLQQRLRDADWNDFRLRHGKHYNNETEEKARFQVWSARAADIDAHNARDDVSYQRTHHFHADFFDHEINNILGLRLPNDKKGLIEYPTSVAAPAAAAPAFVDWRQSGLVTPVKDQGQCGSCWSFSSVGALEGQYFKKNKKLLSFSEQEFVDCTYSTRNGCDGGWMADAFNFAKKGVTTGSVYPYVSGSTKTASSCKFKSSTSIFSTQSTPSKVVGDDENNILNAVATVGPLSIAVCVNDEFMSYKSGVYTDSPCDNSNENHTVNHAVLLVGYNTSPSDGPYWIVKNSWSSSWGESGYIRVARNKRLINNAIYPLI